MKKITLLFIAFIGSGLLFAQAPKKVVLEDETGSWCGYCPRGKTQMESILASYPNAIGIANHNGDTYQSNYAYDIDNTENTYGYPGGMIDRILTSPETTVVCATNYWTSRTANRLLVSTPVAVSISSTYNSSTGAVNATVNATYVGNASGDMRISCVVVEDSVVNTADPQHNYMGNGCSSPDPSSPWYTSPCTIPTYIQRDIARMNLAPDWGTQGVIPASVTASASSPKLYSQSYSGTISTSWNASHVKLVAFVSYYSTTITACTILNADEIRLGATDATGIIENNINSVELKQNAPNPFRDITAIQFQLNTTDNVSVKIYNTMGQEVNTLVNNALVPGLHTFYWAGDYTDGTRVQPGVYYYKISTSTQSVSKAMIYAGQQ